MPSYYLNKRWPIVKLSGYEIRIKIQGFSFEKMFSNMLSAKWWPLCQGLDMLIVLSTMMAQNRSCYFCDIDLWWLWCHGWSYKEDMCRLWLKRIFAHTSFFVSLCQKLLSSLAIWAIGKHWSTGPNQVLLAQIIDTTVCQENFHMPVGPVVGPCSPAR